MSANPLRTSELSPERESSLLSWRFRRSWAEVDLSKIELQARRIKEHCGKQLMAIVKADAYGHGAVEVAKTLEAQVCMFGVANLLEALELKNQGIQKPILLLGAALPEEVDYAIQQGIELSLSCLEQLECLQQRAKYHGRKARVHLVIDTGMGRLGLVDSLFSEELIARLKAYDHVEWRGIATHLPSADEDAEFTHEEISRFLQIVEKLKSSGLNFEWIHACNSAGSLGYSKEDLLSNLVRVGLYLYGINPLRDTTIQGSEISADLALTWKTQISVLRELPEGSSISYGRTVYTKRPSLVVTLACGYADGYPRQVSGKGMTVLIHGRRCPILGRVTMDQMMVDVTDLGDVVKVGDEAVLLGHQGQDCICPEELADKAGTISWHTLTGIGKRVPRFYSSGC